MPYIGSSRYKYSPYLTIYFSQTERFTPGEPVPPFEGSSTFSLLPVERQLLALHLSFEESNTYIDHSPANHFITSWGTGTLTSGACSASLASIAEYSITQVVDEAFPKTRVYRPNVYVGTLGSSYGGLTAEGNWRKMMENDFTVEGYYFNSRDLYANGGDFDCVFFNIGDENSSGNSQKRLLNIDCRTDVGGGALRFRVGEISGTQVTVLSITTNQFVADCYYGTYVEPFPIGVTTYPPKELAPKVRGTNNWRYWCVEKYGNVIKATLTGNPNVGSFVSTGSINVNDYNFGALSVPSGQSTASYSIQPHISGWNQASQIASLDSGGIVPIVVPESAYYDDIRITPYARYNGDHPIMGGPIGPKRPNSDHFDYDDW
jgi:hypothetical protein